MRIRNIAVRNRRGIEITGGAKRRDGDFNPLSEAKGAVSVSIGGKEADLPHAGAAAGSLAGILQIRARIPLDARAGDVPVFVTVGESTSQERLTVRVE